MKRDPNVDRTLGELWLISDIITADINADFEAAKERARRWHPSVCPTNWRPQVGYYDRRAADAQ